MHQLNAKGRLFLRYDNKALTPYQCIHMLIIILHLEHNAVEIFMWQITPPGENNAQGCQIRWCHCSRAHKIVIEKNMKQNFYSLNSELIRLYLTQLWVIHTLISCPMASMLDSRARVPLAASSSTVLTVSNSDLTFVTITCSEHTTTATMWCSFASTSATLPQTGAWVSFPFESTPIPEDVTSFLSWIHLKDLDGKWKTRSLCGNIFLHFVRVGQVEKLTK